MFLREKIQVSFSFTGDVVKMTWFDYSDVVLGVPEKQQFCLYLPNSSSQNYKAGLCFTLDAQHLESRVKITWFVVRII